MILGVGIDLVSVARIQELLSKFGTKFEKKIFTTNEIKKAQKIKISKDASLARALFYAKRFAAKEALAKASGFGIGKNIGFLDIEIDNDKLGKPFVKLTDDKLKNFKDSFQTSKIDINLSLSDEFLIGKKISDSDHVTKIYLAQAIVIISN